MLIYGPRVAVMPILRPYRFHDIRGNMKVTSLLWPLLPDRPDQIS